MSAAELHELVDVAPDDEDGYNRLLDRAQAQVHDDPQSARALAEHCASQAELLGYPNVRARSSYLLARIHTERGEFEEALRLIDTTRSLWLEGGQTLLAMRTDLGRMQILDDLGHHREALAVGKALVDALNELDVPEADIATLRWMRAAALDNTGVAYSFIGEHETALASYALAEKTYDELGMTAERARPLANRGIELLALGRAREAVAALTEAQGILVDSGDRVWSAKLSANVAHAHVLLGDLVSALRELRPAWALLVDAGAEAEAIRLQLALATTYLAAGLHDEASSTAEEVRERAIAAGMRHDAGFAALALAEAQAALGAHQVAASRLAEAARLFDEVGDRQFATQAMIAGAELAASQGHDRAALDGAERVTNAARLGGWSVLAARSALLRARLDTANADEQLRLAGVLVDALQLPKLRYAFHRASARQMRACGDVAGAEASLRRAVELGELWGADLPDPFLRVMSWSDAADAHDDLVDLLVDRQDALAVAEACRVTDRGKSRSLTGLVSAAVGRRGRPGPEDSEGDGIAELYVDLSAVYAALSVETSPTHRALMQDQAAGLERRINLHRVHESLQQESVVDVVAAPREQLQSPRRPTVAYHVVGEDILVFALTGSTVTVRRSAGGVAVVDRELDSLADQWQRFRMGDAFIRRNERVLTATAQNSLRELYRVLVEPIEDVIDSTQGSDLVVVPHRRLHQVPFHALHDGVRSLDDTRAVTVTPTVGRGPADWTPFTKESDVLVVAVDDESTPAVVDEARAISSLLPWSTVLGRERATFDNMAAALPESGVVHLACHGVYRPRSPLFSAVKLADRWVTASEILTLDLRGSLVVLSACESGKGSTASVEPVGLAWAFLVAGARGVVVSHWLVDDADAAGLMVDFYRRLQSGDHPGAALQHARRTAARRHPHPYHWAPFTYVAASSPEDSRWR